jgi:hypothetical protein
MMNDLLSIDTDDAEQDKLQLPNLSPKSPVTASSDVDSFQKRDGTLLTASGASDLTLNANVTSSSRMFKVGDHENMTRTSFLYYFCVCIFFSMID